jgi:phage terminase large subunit-like protein
LNDSPKKPLLNRKALAAERLRRQRRKIDSYFPAAGPLRRELYAKHLEFFRAGAQHRERLFMAGNRVGKTETGCYEDALHLTGQYPDWWAGRRFSCPVDAWVACETSALTRDVLQEKLLGPWGSFGLGLIPGDTILDFTRKTGTGEAVDVAHIRHVSGGVSHIGFKSYKEGRANFQGTAKHLIHFDEEPDISTYTEALLRTAIVPGTTAGGLMLVTFTPLKGPTAVVEAFLDTREVAA